MDRVVNVLHISDIHLNSKDDFAQDVVIQGFLTDLAKLEALEIKPDLLVVSGDLARAADQSDAYDNFLDFILKVVEITGLDESRVVMCPGNHDVSRNAVGPNLPAVREWRDKALNRDDANQLHVDAAYSAHVFRTFSGYYALADSFAREAIVKTGQSFTSYYFREFGLFVIAFNTATLSSAGLVSGRDDERKLVLPERAIIEAMSAVPKDAHVLVTGHHPTSWLNENNEDTVRRLLGKSASMYLCGHIHLARPETVTGILGNCYYAQTGALYEWRDNWNGYALYQMVPRTPHVKAYYRRWYEDRREFSKAEDLADDGVIFSSPDAAPFFHGLKLQISRTLLEDWRSRFLLPALESECSKTLAPVPIEECFVPPEFERDILKSRDDLDLATRKEVITFATVMASEGNYIISARSQSGKSTLLRQWAIGLARKGATGPTWTVPVLVNFSELRDYTAYVESVISRKLPAIPEKLGGVGRMLDQGMLTVFVDDVDFSERKKLKALSQFMERYPTCRYVLASIGMLFEGATVSPVVSETLPFTHIYLRPLKRKDLLSLIESHNVVDSKQAADQLLERVTREANSLNVPLNAVSASFFIQIFSAEPDRILVNRATLVERYIELLLQKFARPDVELRSFDFKLKRDLLSVIARHMVDEEDDEPSYNAVLQIVINYVNHYGFPQDATAIVAHLVSCRILEKVEREDGSHLRFPLSSFYHYFVAFRMIEDESFRTKIFDPLNYLAFSEEISFYAALVRNDERLISYVFESLKLSSKDMWTDAPPEVQNGSFMDSFVEPNAEATEEELFAISEVVKSNEETEVSRNHRLEENIEEHSKNQKVKRPEFNTVGDQWVAHLLLASSVLKHMELIPNEKKIELLAVLVHGWLQFCAMSLSLVPKLVKDKTVELHGVLYRLSFNTHEPMGELARRISLVMPISVAQIAAGSMGSEKLRLQLADGIGTDKLGPSDQLLRALLLAEIGVPGISKILKDAASKLKDNRFLRNVLMRKLYDVAIRYRLERGELEDVRNLAGDMAKSINWDEKSDKKREALIDNLRKRRLVAMKSET